MYLSVANIPYDSSLNDQGVSANTSALIAMIIFFSKTIIDIYTLL